MNPDQTNKSSTNEISWTTKARYVGTGVLVGVIIAPVLRGFLAKIQPKIDAFLESMTGKTEEYAEKASDLFYKAKEEMKDGGSKHKKKEPHDGCSVEKH